jgi:hypothetical protein
MDIDIRCNVGTQERVFRFLTGVAATSFAFSSKSPGIKVLAGGIGLLGLGTGITRYCPINQLLGLNRCQPAFRSVRQLMRRI